jgi:nucleoside-triphosphatase
VPDQAPRFLLTGQPRSGKSTLVAALARQLRASGITLGGFTAREVRSHGERVGFEVADFDGRRALMAHVGWTTGPQVLRYRVDVAAFDGIAVPAVEHALSAADVIIVDEIGLMQLCSPAIGALVERLFTAVVPSVATVHARPHPFTDELKQRPGTELLELTPANREDTLARLLARLR